jgi:transposase
MIMLIPATDQRHIDPEGGFTMTGEMFKAYTEQFLVPTLKRGDIVLDNIGVHKVARIEEAIEARGAIPFYLPAYSPDLNPIE